MKPFRTLILDDDKYFVKTTRELIEGDRVKLVRTPGQPIEIDHAGDWQEAIAKLNSSSLYDLILFDLKFPDAPGGQDEYQDKRLKEVRTLQPRATVAVATSFAYEQGLERCTRVLGEELAEEFIPKDQPWNVVVQRLVRAMKLKSRRLLAFTRPTDLASTTQEDVEVLIGQHMARLQARFEGTAETEWIAQEITQLKAEMAIIWNSVHLGEGDRGRINWDDVTDQLRGCFSAYGIELQVDYSIDFSLVSRRSDLLTALDAIIQNAIESMLERSESRREELMLAVGVKIFHEDKFVKIKVTDHGVGFAPEALQHLFERGHSSWKTQAPPHHGMGLYVARRRLWAIGGDVTVDSAPERDGAVVTLHALELSPA